MWDLLKIYCVSQSISSMNYPGYDPKLNVVRTYDLVEELYGVYQPGGVYGFFSLDVKSMFDVIPMEAVVRIVREKLNMGSSYNYTDDAGNRCQIPALINADVLCQLIMEDCDVYDVFMYDSPLGPKVCKSAYLRQRKGIPMGGNTSNVYADLYMGYFISLMKEELKALGVLLLRKYVDDLLVYAPVCNANEILELFKKMTYLEYTIEMPVDGVLSYLDISLLDDGHTLRTSW